MDTQNRADRRRAAKASGMRGQVVTAGVVVVPQPVTSVTLAGAVVAAIEGLVKRGGDPYAHAVITIGNDHPEHPGELVVEGKTDRMARPVLGEPFRRFEAE